MIKKLWIAVEAKFKQTNVQASTHYFRKKLDSPFTYQVVYEPGIDFMSNNVRVISADKFLLSLV